MFINLFRNRNNRTGLDQRNTRVLYSLIDYLSAMDVINNKHFIDYCNNLKNDSYLFEIQRDENDARSKYHNLHPGGPEATLELARMAGIDHTKTVLDAGAGHGGSSRILAENLGCHVTGIENNFIRLLDAIFRTKMLGMDDKISFRLCDAYNMDFPESRFDVIFRQHAVYGNDEKHFLENCYRILKNNGLLAFNGTFKCVKLSLKKKINIEDYTLEGYETLLNNCGFKLTTIETEKSTRELLKNFEMRTDDTGKRIRYLIKKNKVIGFKLIAQKVSV